MNGDLTSLLKGLNLSKIISGANKTLSFVKQAIPVYRQVQPMVGNFKNLVNIYSTVKDDDKKEPEEDEIIQSRPIKITKPSQTRNGNNEPIMNDTLTFFH